MRTKTIIILACICFSAIAFALPFATGKNQVTVVPLSEGDAELTAAASAELINAFSSIESIAVKEISPKLDYKAEMTYSFGSNKFPPADKEKLFPLRYGELLEQSFTSDKFALAGLQLRVSAYGAIPAAPYILYLKDSEGILLREAVVNITEKDGVQDVTVLFEPIINSKNKSYSFVLAPPKIERENIIGISVTPTEKPDPENKETDAKKIIINTNFNPVYAEFTITDNEKQKTRNVSYLSSADYIIYTNVSKGEDFSVLNLKVYSRSLDVITFVTEDVFSDTADLAAKSLTLALQIENAILDKLPEPVFIEPALGTSDQSVFLNWNPILEGYNARIYRATHISGPFHLIGTSNSSSYIDRDAECGLLYWYKVQPFNDQINGNLSQAAPGYKKDIIKGANIQKLLAAKKLNPPVERTGYAQRDVQKEMDFIKEWYMNNVKLSVIMTVGKSYIDNGLVYVFENMDDYSLNLRKREIYLLKDDALIKFYSKKLFDIRQSSMPLNNIIATAEFGAAGNADDYSATGFSSPPQQDLRWNEISAPSLEFDIDKPASDLFVDMYLAPPWIEEPYTCKKVEVFANDVSVGSITVTGRGKYRVTVPANLITNNKLRLNFYITGTANSANKDSYAKIAFYSVTVSKKFLQDDLFTRLIKNGVFYCLYEKDVPITQPDGTLKYVPMFNAVAISTEYYKNNKNWRGTTIAITSSDKELVEKVKKIKK